MGYDLDEQDKRDVFLQSVSNALADLSQQNSDLRKERNMYRGQLKQLNRAHRLSRLEYKELKAKYDDLVSGNYIRAEAYADAIASSAIVTEEEIEACIRNVLRTGY